MKKKKSIFLLSHSMLSQQKNNRFKVLQSESYTFISANLLLCTVYVEYSIYLTWDFLISSRIPMPNTG